MALGKASTFTKNLRDKPKKPKDLPKTSVNKGNISPMIAPNVYATRGALPTIAPRATLDFSTVVPNTVTPHLTSTGAGPALTPSPTTYTPTNTGAGNAGATGQGTGDYAPAAVLSGYLNQNPDVVAADTLAGMGITNPDVINMLADLVGAGPALYLLTQGANAGFQTSPGQEVDALTGLAQSLMTPGAAGFSLNGLMDTILNADPNSPLGAFLATGGPDAVNDLIRVAAMMGTSNPYFQQGIDKQLDQMDLGYRRDFAHGAVQNPDAYYSAVRQGPLGRYF